MNQKFESNFGAVAGLAFDHFLRTGRRDSGRFGAGGIEHKFNPNHDPDNGRFTSGAGVARGSGGGMASVDRRGQATEEAKRPAAEAAKPTGAKKPAVDDAGDVGALSAKYEARGRLPGKISNGKNDPGGRSYGIYQFSSTKGTLVEFLNSPEASTWSAELNGLKPVTPEFDRKWKEIAARDPEGFAAAQDSFTNRTLYRTAVRGVAARASYDLAAAHIAVRQAVFSTSVQHGGSGGVDIVGDAVKLTDAEFKRNDKLYQRALIMNIYAVRGRYTERARDRHLKAGRLKKANELNNVIKNRFPEELELALKRFDQGQ